MKIKAIGALTVLSLDETARRLGLCKSSIQRMEQRGEFIRRIKISPFRTGFRSDELERWIASRPRGGSRCNANIRSNKAAGK